MRVVMTLLMSFLLLPCLHLYVDLSFTSLVYVFFVDRWSAYSLHLIFTSLCLLLLHVEILFRETGGLPRFHPKFACSTHPHKC